MRNAVFIGKVSTWTWAKNADFFRKKSQIATFLQVIGQCALHVRRFLTRL